MRNKTFSIKSAINKDSKVQTLTFEGDLGIKNCESIRNTLLAIKFNNGPVTLHLKNVEKLDITSIQIIRAVRKAVASGGGNTEVRMDLSQEISRLLTNAGFGKEL